MLHIEKPSTLTVLSFSFVFIIIATSVFISFISLYNEKKAVEDLAKQLQVQFFVNIREKLEGGFFSSGLMNRDNDSTYRVSLLDSQGKVIRMPAETPDYDARTRSWYKTAVEAGKAAWSPVYIWASATDIGITAALPVYDTEGSLVLLCIIVSLAALWAALIIARRMASLNQSLELEVAEHRHAEETLKETEKQFRSMFENHHAVMLLIDPESGKIIRSNKSAQKYYGYAAEEFEHLTIQQINQLNKEEIETEMANARLEKRNHFQFPHKMATGEIRDVEIHSSPIPFKGKTLLFSIIHDITERKQMEQELRISLEKYRVLFESFPIGISVTDTNGNLLEVNRESERLLGVSVTEHTGRKIDGREWKIIRPDGTPLPGEEYASVRALKTRQMIENMEMGIIKENQETTWINVHAAPIPLEGYGVIITYHDITERKRAEEALLESEKKYRILAENAQDVIWTLDNNYKFTYISPSIYKLRGYTPEEAMEESYLETLTPESLNVVKQIQQRRLEADAQGRFDTISDFEVEQYCKDGSTVWVRIITHQIYDDHKNTIGYLGISRNIDKRKQIESELVTAKIAAESATRAKSEFLASMSHEIRTPMNVIVNMSKLLLETDLNSEQSNYARMVCESSDILLSLINDILDFSKIEAGKLDLESVDFNLESVVREVMRILGLKADEKGLHLRCFIYNDIYKHLQGDPSRLRQILINLVNNAIKFTHKGEVKITVTAEKQSETNTVIRFEVSDTGIGIPKDRVDRLFKPFSQADSSTTRKYGGTGLGLSISKKLVEMMGGEISAESKEGVGSTFWFTACFIKRLVKTDEMSEVIYQKQTRTSERLPLPAIRILLVEDNLFNQHVALAVLKKYGLSADIANNGKEAVEILETTRYDLVLMDIEMPEMNGMEATKIIRNSDSENRNVPIIAMTAHALKGSRERFIEAGMNDYLTKPIDPDILYTAICGFAGLR